MHIIVSLPKAFRGILRIQLQDFQIERRDSWGKR